MWISVLIASPDKELNLYTLCDYVTISLNYTSVQNVEQSGIYDILPVTDIYN